jgi:hypothetical protein
MVQMPIRQVKAIPSPIPSTLPELMHVKPRPLEHPLRPS